MGNVGNGFLFNLDTLVIERHLMAEEEFKLFWETFAFATKLDDNEGDTRLVFSFHLLSTHVQ